MNVNMKKPKLHLLLWLLCFVLTAHAEEKLSSSERNFIVKAHNRERRRTRPEAADMRRIGWDINLEEMARQWVSNCSYETKISDDKNIGANFFFNERPTFGEFSLDLFVRKAIRHWSNRRKRFEYKRDCGRACTYVKMIYALTEHIGCAFNTCPSLSSDEVKSPFLVCFYSPSDINGSLPYQIGRSCSKCPEGSNCVDRLCSGGNQTSHEWDKLHQRLQRGDSIKVWQNESPWRKKNSGQGSKSKQETNEYIFGNSQLSKDLNHLDGESNQFLTSHQIQPKVQNTNAKQHKPTSHSQLPGTAMPSLSNAREAKNQPRIQNKPLQQNPSIVHTKRSRQYRSERPTQLPERNTPSFQNQPCGYVVVNHLPSPYLPMLQNQLPEQDMPALQNPFLEQLNNLHPTEPQSQLFSQHCQNQAQEQFQTILNAQSPQDYQSRFPSRTSSNHNPILPLPPLSLWQLRRNVLNQPIWSSQPYWNEINRQVSLSGQRPFFLPDKVTIYNKMNNHPDELNPCNLHPPFEGEYAVALQNQLNERYLLELQNQLRTQYQFWDLNLRKPTNDHYLLGVENQMVNQYLFEEQKPSDWQGSLAPELMNKRIREIAIGLQNQITDPCPLQHQMAEKQNRPLEENQMVWQLPFGLPDQLPWQFPLALQKRNKEQRNLNPHNEGEQLLPTDLQNQMTGQGNLVEHDSVKGQRIHSFDIRKPGRFPLDLQNLNSKGYQSLHTPFEGQSTTNFDNHIAIPYSSDLQIPMYGQNTMSGEDHTARQLPLGLHKLRNGENIMRTENHVAGELPLDLNKSENGEHTMCAHDHMVGQLPLGLNTPINEQNAMSPLDDLTKQYPLALHKMRNGQDTISAQNHMIEQFPLRLHKLKNGQNNMRTEDHMTGQFPLDLRKSQNREHSIYAKDHMAGQLPLGLHKVENEQNFMRTEDQMARQFTLGLHKLKNVQDTIPAQNHMVEQFPLNLHSPIKTQNANDIEYRLRGPYPFSTVGQDPLVLNKPNAEQPPFGLFNHKNGEFLERKDSNNWGGALNQNFPESRQQPFRIDSRKPATVPNHIRPLPYERETRILDSMDKQNLIQAHNRARLQIGQEGLSWDPYLEFWSKRVIRCDANFPGQENAYTNFGTLPLNEPIPKVVEQWMRERYSTVQRSRHCRTAYDESICTPFSNIIQPDISNIGCAAQMCDNYQKVICIYDNMEGRQQFFVQNQKGSSQTEAKLLK